MPLGAVCPTLTQQDQDTAQVDKAEIIERLPLITDDEPAKIA